MYYLPPAESLPGDYLSHGVVLQGQYEEEQSAPSPDSTQPQAIGTYYPNNYYSSKICFPLL